MRRRLHLRSGRKAEMRPPISKTLEKLLESSTLISVFPGHFTLGSQEIPGTTGKFGLGVQDEARQRITEFCQENTLVIETPFNNTKR